MLSAVSLTGTRYVGGAWNPGTFSGKQDNLLLLFDAEGVHVRVFLKDKFFLPWASVRGLHVEGPDEAAKRVTLTRVAVLGLGAFAFKKKSKQDTFITVEGPDGPLFFEVKSKKGPFEIRAQLSQFEGLVAPARPEASQLPAVASQGTLGEQLNSLHELHQSGALSDAEFEQAKRRLLSG